MAYDTAWRILGNPTDTEDAVQDAFLDALRLDREGRQSIRNVGGLLRHLVARRAVDLLRRRRGAPVPATADHAAPAHAQPQAVAVGHELAARLRIALAELPERESEVFVLRYFADMPNADIATHLRISPGAVGVALHKARTRLQELLDLNEDPS
jgi:RNA polymerase sigma-70 factor (ECF subfamily)